MASVRTPLISISPVCASITIPLAVGVLGAAVRLSAEPRGHRAGASSAAVQRRQTLRQLHRSIDHGGLAPRMSIAGLMSATSAPAQRRLAADECRIGVACCDDRRAYGWHARPRSRSMTAIVDSPVAAGSAGCGSAGQRRGPDGTGKTGLARPTVDQSK